MMSWSRVSCGLLENFSISVATIFAAFIAFVLWRREKSSLHLDGFCVLGSMAIMGHDGWSIRAFLHDPDLATVVAMLPIIALWLCHNRDYRRIMAVLSFELYLCVRMFYVFEPEADSWLQFVRYWPMLAFVCSIILHRSDCRRWRQVLLAAVFWLGARSFGDSDLASLDYFCLAFLWLAGASIIGGLVPLPFLPAYLLFGAATRRVIPAPDSAVHWGWVVIALAFGVFGFAFLVTRKRLAAESRHALPESTHVA